MRWIPLLAGVVLVAGCWARESQSFRSPEFESQRIRTIAVLPIVNQAQAQAPMAFEPAMVSTARLLQVEKKYAVVPPAQTARVLRSGAGAAMLSQLMNSLSKQQPVAEEVFVRLARELEADALFSETVVSFHQVPEQGATVGNQGGVYYQNFDVSVVEVSAELWSAKSRSVVWRDEHLERFYHDRKLGHTSNLKVVESATRQLLANFPVNTWAPVEPPKPTPVPSPVLSYKPFPMPADPLEQR